MPLSVSVLYTNMLLCLISVERSLKPYYTSFQKYLMKCSNFMCRVLFWMWRKILKVNCKHVSKLEDLHSSVEKRHSFDKIPQKG